MTRPVAETNEPLPPELNRTLAFCKRSSHCLVDSKLYFSFSCLAGGALKSHIPSSAVADVIEAITNAMVNKPSFREIIPQHKALKKPRQLSVSSCSSS